MKIIAQHARFKCLRSQKEVIGLINQLPSGLTNQNPTVTQIQFHSLISLKLTFIQTNNQRRGVDCITWIGLKQLRKPEERVAQCGKSL